MIMVSIVGLLFFLVVVVMLPLGIVLIVRSGKGRVPYPSCGRCGYDLTGYSTESDACPECGSRYTEAGIIPAQLGRRKGMLSWGIVLVVLPVLLFGLTMVGVMSARNRAQSTFIQAQRQAQLINLQQQASMLQVELAAVRQERDETTDEAALAEFEERIQELTDQLETAESELESMEQPGGN